MHFNYLIIGQGICGTMLSWFLKEEGKSFLVVDDGRSDTSSRVAAGLINPVTGRRYHPGWMIEEVMPFSVDVYKRMGDFLQVELVRQKSIIDFFPSPSMLENFTTRLTENDTYLHSYPDQNKFNQYFNHDFGCGEISPVFIVSLPVLLNKWKEHLVSNGQFLETAFQLEGLQVKEDVVLYKDVSADAIIFCDGVQGMTNPWFRLLPFSSNKGEALIIECPGLTNEHVFKKGMLLVPMQEPGIFWLGSNFIWEFEDLHPTEAFRKQAANHLEQWLRLPFRIIDHKASARPSTLERRPFVGMHPMHAHIGILNGMGTKGSSLAPFFANQLAHHLVHGLPIHPDADVSRFRRILSK